MDTLNTDRRILVSVPILLLLFLCTFLCTVPTGASAAEPRLADGLAVVTDAATLERSRVTSFSEAVELKVVLTDVELPGINAIQFGLEVDPRLTVLSTDFAPGTILQFEVEPGEFVVGFDRCVAPSATPFVVATVTVLTPPDAGALSDLTVDVRDLTAFGEPMRVTNCFDTRITRDVVDMGGVVLNPTVPTIPFFGASSNVVVEGRDYTLGWTTIVGAEAALDGEVVAPAGTRTVRAVANTTHELVVGTSASASVEVEVIRQPRIVSFDAVVSLDYDPPRTRLSWEVLGASTVSIDGFGEQPARGGLVTDLDPSAVYVLRATNEFGENVETALVEGASDIPPAVLSFTATPNPFGPGEAVTLAWSTFLADAATISPDVGAVDPAGGSVEVFPASTVTYTLTVTNAFGSDTQDLVVEPSPPVIESFTLSPSAILQGETITLDWSTRFADTVRLEPDGVDLAASGSLDLTPEASTTYRLVASNAFGTVERTRAVQVTVPVIANFAILPQEIFPGGSVIVQWEVTPGVALRIEPDVGPLDAAVGSRSIVPTADGIVYELIGSVAGQDVLRAEAGPVTWLPPALDLELTSSIVVPNEPFSLRVICQGCDTLEVLPDPGSLDLFGVPEVSEFASVVDSTTVYVARATNAAGTSVDSLLVDPEPFQPVATLGVEPVASGGVLFPGERVRVFGTLRYAAFATITPGRETGLPNGDYDFQFVVEDSTTFELFAENAFGRVTRTALAAPAPPLVSLRGPEGAFTGEPFDLILEVEGADQVFLEPGFGEVPGSGTFTTTLDSTTTFTARAVNAVGTSTAAWTVTLSAPIVDTFVASRSTIVAGDSVRLEWNVRGADRIDLFENGLPLAENVAATSGFDATPVQTSQYTLRAENEVGVTLQTLDVTVAPIAIQSFTAQPTVVPVGGTSTLSWELRGSGTAELVGFGDVPLIGSQDVTVSGTTTYDLVARSGGEEIDRAQVTVGVDAGDQPVVRWSWTETGENVFPPQIIPFVPFEAWVIAEDLVGGILAFEVGAVVSPDVFILAAGPPQATAVTVFGHPDWVVGTGICLSSDTVPLLRYEFLTVSAGTIGGDLDLRGVLQNPSLPSGDPAYSDCADRIRAFDIGVPLSLDGGPVAAATVELSATARNGAVELRWEADGVRCAERVLVYRTVGDAAIERIAELRDLDACGTWVDLEAPLARDDLRYRVTVETDAAALVSAETRVADAPDGDRLPTRARLLENVPNPFNPSTDLRFALPRAGRVQLSIFDTAGRLVRSLDLGEQPAGEGRVTWTGLDAAGRTVGSGVYLVRLDSEDGVDTRRVLLVK